MEQDWRPLNVNGIRTWMTALPLQLQLALAMCITGRRGRDLLLRLLVQLLQLFPSPPCEEGMQTSQNSRSCQRRPTRSCTQSSRYVGKKQKFK